MNYEFELAWYAMNVSAGSNWRAPTAILTNCSFVNTATTGSYQNVLVPVTASVGTGCTSRYFITVPASRPSATTATIVISTPTWSADQVNGVRFEMFVNAVPTVLN